MKANSPARIQRKEKERKLKFFGPPPPPAAAADFERVEILVLWLCHR